MLSQASGARTTDKDGTSCRWRGRFARERLQRVQFYIQDSWRLRPNLTITAGLRYSLYSPPYEINGLQVAPTISMGQWFDQRVENMKNGIPSNASQIVTFDLAGPKNGKQGFYEWDKNNFAPRCRRVDAECRQGSWAADRERPMVIRGGYSKVFDRDRRQGSPRTSIEGFAFGMSTQISSPFGAAYETDPAVAIRQRLTTMPPTMPAAPPGGFPQTPP